MKNTHMQTNPFRAEEATLYITCCTWLLSYDYLLYTIYVTGTLMNILNYNYSENLSLDDISSVNSWLPEFLQLVHATGHSGRKSLVTIAYNSNVSAEVVALASHHKDQKALMGSQGPSTFSGSVYHFHFCEMNYVHDFLLIFCCYPSFFSWAYTLCCDD